MAYKISMKIQENTCIRDIKHVLGNNKINIENVATCLITKPDGNTIKYLDIYFKHLINIEDYFSICMDLDDIRYNHSDNIKLKSLKTNEVIYSISPYYMTEKRKGKLTRKYTKIYI